MTRTHAPSETEKLIADLTSRLAENEAEIAYLHTQFQRLASPVPEITFESNKVSGGGAGSTTLVNGFKGNVTIAAGTNISILNSTNIITIANTYTLPNTVLTNTSTYVKGIAAGTNISFSTTANIIKINNTYTLPNTVLTNTSTYVKSLVAGTNISITSTAHTFTIANTYTLPATVLTNTSTYVKSLNTLGGAVKLAAGTGVTITTTATTKTLTLSASASGGGSINSTTYSSTVNTTIIFLATTIGTVKTGSNGKVKAEGYIGMAELVGYGGIRFTLYQGTSSTQGTGAARFPSSTVLEYDYTFWQYIDGTRKTINKAACTLNFYFAGLTPNSTYTLKFTNIGTSSTHAYAYVVHAEGT